MPKRIKACVGDRFYQQLLTTQARQWQATLNSIPIAFICPAHLDREFDYLASL